MASSFVKCIENAIINKAIDNSDAQELIRKYNELESIYKSRGIPNYEELAEKNLSAMQERAYSEYAQEVLTGISSQKKFNEFYNNLDGSLDYQGKNRASKIMTKFYDVIKHKIDSRYHQNLRAIKEYSDKIRSMSNTDALKFMKDLYSEHWGSTGNKEAAKFSDLIEGIHKANHQEVINAGGIMGFIKKYRPQFHTDFLIKKAGVQRWIDDLLGKSDRPRLLNLDEMKNPETGLGYTEAEIIPKLKEIYDDIVNNGVSTSRISNQELHRFFKFKDAESFFAYNNMYGVGDEGLWHGYLKSLYNISEKVETTKAMGNNRDAMIKHIQKTMAENGASQRQQRNAEIYYRALTNSIGARDTGMVASFQTGTDLFRGVLRGSKLGKVFLAAFTDPAFHWSATKLYGLTGSDGIVSYFSSIADRKILKQLGYDFGDFSDEIHAISRNFGEFEHLTANKGIAGKIENFNNTMTHKLFKYSGASMQTNIAYLAAAKDLSRTILGLSKSSFDEVNPAFKQFLTEFGINSKSWDSLRKVKPVIKEGREFISSDAIRMMGKEYSDLANTFGAMHEAIASTALNLPNIRTKAITSGLIFGGAANHGSIARLVASNAFLFKSFTLTSTLTHTMPVIARIWNTGGGQEHLRHLGGLLALSMTAAMISQQARELFANKTPADITPSFVGKAMINGGALGFFGDLLGLIPDMRDRDIISYVSGPVLGEAIKGGKAFRDLGSHLLEGEPAKGMADAFKYASGLVPFTNLWYASSMFNHSLDAFLKYLDPEMINRKEQTIKRKMNEKGQQYLIEKGLFD